MKLAISLLRNVRFFRYYRPFAAILLVVFSLWLAGEFIFDSLRDAAKDEQRSLVSAIGKLKVNQIENWLDDRHSDIQTLAIDSYFARDVQQWLLSGRKNNEQRQRIAGRLNAFIKSHHYYSVALYDARGRFVLRVGQHNAHEENMSEYARSAMRSGKTELIDLHLHDDASFPVGFGFMSPLSAGGRISGAVHFSEDPESYLFPLIERWPVKSETAETHLVRKEGARVLFLNRLRKRDDPPLTFSLPLDTQEVVAARAISGGNGLLEHLHDYTGDAVLSFAMPVAGTPWILVSKVAEQEAFSLVNRIERIAFLLMAFILFIGTAWFWQWRRREQAMADAQVLHERLRVDELRIESERRFRVIFEHAALAMARLSLKGEFIEVNDAWCEMFGYSRDDVLSSHITWQQVTYPEDIELGASLIRKLLDGEMEAIKLEKRYLRKDGSTLWGSLQASVVHDEHGRPDYMISAIQDITERKQVEQQINFMAYHDRLTGLPNRALLFDRLSQAMSWAKRDSKHVALLFVDLDGFKDINDQHGHEAGDAVLKMAAQRFLACVRAMDTVARFGGDEFAIVLGNLDDPLQAKSIAEKIVQAFVQPMALLEGLECSVGASVGISIYPEHGSAMDSLMTAADQAMYESKRNGKGKYSFFKTGTASELPWLKIEAHHLVGVEEIDEQHANLVYLVNRLNDALKHNESTATVTQMFEELLMATAHHFETESRFMASCHYPEQAAHEEEHAHLVNEAMHLKLQFSEGRELLALQTIKDWLLNHIIYSDKKMAAYLLQHGVR